MAFSKGLKSPEDYNCLTPIIQGVNKEVISNEESKAVAVQIMDKAVCYVVKRLAETDETFRLVYNDIRRVGSYFDRLRVTKPTEFDVNIVLKFPFHRMCKIENSKPGYVRVCVKSWMEVKKDMGKIYAQHIRNRIDWKLEQMVDIKGYICRDKVLAWWQSIFAKALHQPHEDIIDGQRYMMKWSVSGPAITLHVECLNNGVKLDIDLVPVIKFSDNEARCFPTAVYQSHRDRNPELSKEWYIVPKAISDEDTNRRWRLSFTDQEKTLMRGKDHLKPTNRLLKAMRDKSGWKKLNSYMIKTVFLHETEHDESFYRHNLGYLLVHSLSTLKVYLERKKLPFYWHSKRNMFINISKTTSRDMSNRLERILTQIHILLDSPSELEIYVRSLFL